MWSVALPPGGVPSANGEPSPLWQAVYDRVRYVHAHHRMGLAMRYLNPSDDLVLLPLYLMAAGAAVGFSGYCIWSCSGGRKG